MKPIRILVVGDVYGNHEVVTNAITEFTKGDYDKLIFLGNYASSISRSDEDILRCFRIISDAKLDMGDDVIALLGKHDIQYYEENNDRIRCIGYRPTLYVQLHHYLMNHRDEFNHAYSIGNYLMTSAGITQAWYMKHHNTLEKWCNICDFNVGSDSFIGNLLNGVAKTQDAPILYEHDGPLWCRKSLLLTEPMNQVDQIVGHTSTKYITKYKLFGENQKIDNTSVTFVNAVSNKNKFLKLTIDA